MRPNAWIVGLAVCAGFGAVAVTGPLLTTQLLAKTDSANASVTAVIRNDLGQLKWVATEASAPRSKPKADRFICARAAPIAIPSSPDR
jgi:hypothetical protein